VNPPCLHLISFCATGVSSGLAINQADLDECRLGESLQGGGPASDFNLLLTLYVIFVGLLSIWYTLLTCARHEKYKFSESNTNFL
jgi:hypothetical protein